MADADRHGVREAWLFYGLAGCVAGMVLILPVGALAAIVPPVRRMALGMLGRLGAGEPEALMVIAGSACFAVLMGAQAILCHALIGLHDDTAWLDACGAARGASAWAAIIGVVPGFLDALALAGKSVDGGAACPLAAAAALVVILLAAVFQRYPALSHLVALRYEADSLRRLAGLPGRAARACIVGMLVCLLAILVVGLLAGADVPVTGFGWPLLIGAYLLIVGLIGAAMTVTAVMLWVTGQTLSQREAGP